MVHDTARIESIRQRIAAQLELIASLEAQISKGNLGALEVARNQTNDIETVFLRSLDKQDRSPSEEAWWLSSAEHMLGTWAPYLRQTEEQFKKFGGKNIEIVGG